MNDTWLLITIVLAGIATYLTRLSFLTGRTLRATPDRFRLPLRYVPAAILGALIAPAVLLIPETQSFSWENPRLWAGLVALAVAWLSRSVLLTIVSGMTALWLLQWLWSHWNP